MLRSTDRFWGQRLHCVGRVDLARFLAQFLARFRAGFLAGSLALALGRSRREQVVVQGWRAVCLGPVVGSIAWPIVIQRAFAQGILTCGLALAIVSVTAVAPIQGAIARSSLSPAGSQSGVPTPVPPFLTSPSSPVLTWQTPPAPIDRMLDRPIAPAAVFSPDRRWLVELGRPGLPPLSELARPEVALAGLQLDPATYGPRNPYTYRSVAVTDLRTGDRHQVSVPQELQASYFRWSLDGQRLAFTRTTAAGLELWLLDLKTATARQLTGPILNATYGAPCRWLPGEAGLICKVRDLDRQLPAMPSLPPGPTVEENLGRKAPARTYTNLLKNPHDEALFEHYLTSRIERVALDGTRSPFLSPALYDEVTPSPDGQYFLVETIEPPFSYQVPIDRFPRRFVVVDRQGQTIYQAASLPLADNVPVKFGSVREGRREMSWRGDEPATLYWVEALDGGDAGQAADRRDVLYTLTAPFTAQPRELWRSEYRFSAIQWGNAHFALVYELSLIHI